MSDDDDNDYSEQLQSNIVIMEAFQVSENEATSVAEEGMAVQSLARSFETYVQQFQNTWEADWVQSIDAFEKGVKAWEVEIAGTSTKKTSSQPQPQPTSPAGGKSTKRKTTNTKTGK